MVEVLDTWTSCMKCKKAFVLDDLVVEVKKMRKDFFGFGKTPTVTQSDWNFAFIHAECV